MDTITYEGTLSGSRIEGKVISRNEDGSITVEHPDGGGWTYTVRPELIIVDTPPTVDAGDDILAEPNPGFTSLLQQMSNLTWMPLDARERFDAMLRESFTGLINKGY